MAQNYANYPKFPPRHAIVIAKIANFACKRIEYGYKKVENS